MVNNQPIIDDLFNAYPSPEAMISSNVTELAEMIKSLGLYNKRSRALKEMSAAYLEGGWKEPIEMKHIGKYANDAYRMFILGEWREIEPTDKKLKMYHDWIYLHFGEEPQTLPSPKKRKSLWTKRSSKKKQKQ
eukprot:TRINITY_DN1013_c0_g1_i1.p1 TRINITY_DN1013_c0_g1~~TRINITY_DN1013_c0_g1_i1.p1  ORF type:complete len:133 (+),score=23.46 TRINITY_DN1013_c0_g1_i1:329-727(+)